MSFQFSIFMPTERSAGLSRLKMPPRRGKKILAQGKRGWPVRLGPSAALGSRSKKISLPRPIGWGEGRGEGLPLIALVPFVRFAPFRGGMFAQ